MWADCALEGIKANVPPFIPPGILACCTSKQVQHSHQLSIDTLRDDTDMNRLQSVAL